MTSTDHPDSLGDLLGGHLDPEVEEAVLTHLGICDACLAEFEVLWAGRGPKAMSRQPPSMDSGQALQLEQRVLRQVHRDDLSRQMIGVYTRGMWVVLLAFLVPLKPLLRQRTRA